MIASSLRKVAALAAFAAVAAVSCVITGSGGVPDWADCHLNSECTLASSGCCPGCGAPELGRVDAVNRDELAAHRADVCPSAQECPLCAEAQNPNLVATCAAHACQALDVRQNAVSACQQDADCRVRNTACCECNGSANAFDLVAINGARVPAFEALVCDPGTVCDECIPSYPDRVEAFCGADGHCAVRFR